MIQAVLVGVAAGTNIGLLPEQHPRRALVQAVPLPAVIAHSPTLLVRIAEAEEGAPLALLTVLARAQRPVSG